MMDLQEIFSSFLVSIFLYYYEIAKIIYHMFVAGHIILGLGLRQHFASSGEGR